MKRRKRTMKKLNFFAMIDAGIMVVLLFLAYITDYIQRHDTSIYAGLSSMGFWSTTFLLLFLIAAAILFLLLYIIISVHFINKSMRPLKRFSIIVGIIMIVSFGFTAAIDYLCWEYEYYSMKRSSSKWIGNFLIKIFDWSLLISFVILLFIMCVCISVYIIRKMKN